MDARSAWAPGPENVDRFYDRMQHGGNEQSWGCQQGVPRHPSHFPNSGDLDTQSRTLPRSTPVWPPPHARAHHSCPGALENERRHGMTGRDQANREATSVSSRYPEYHARATNMKSCSWHRPEMHACQANGDKPVAAAGLHSASQYSQGKFANCTQTEAFHAGLRYQHPGGERSSPSCPSCPGVARYKTGSQYTWQGPGNEKCCVAPGFRVVCLSKKEQEQGGCYGPPFNRASASCVNGANLAATEQQIPLGAAMGFGQWQMDQEIPAWVLMQQVAQKNSDSCPGAEFTPNKQCYNGLGTASHQVRRSGVDENGPDRHAKSCQPDGLGVAHWTSYREGPVHGIPHHHNLSQARAYRNSVAAADTQLQSDFTGHRALSGALSQETSDDLSERSFPRVSTKQHISGQQEKVTRDEGSKVECRGTAATQSQPQADVLTSACHDQEKHSWGHDGRAWSRAKPQSQDAPKETTFTAPEYVSTQNASETSTTETCGSSTEKFRATQEYSASYAGIHTSGPDGEWQKGAPASMPQVSRDQLESATEKFSPVDIGGEEWGTHAKTWPPKAHPHSSGSHCAQGPPPKDIPGWKNVGSRTEKSGPQCAGRQRPSDNSNGVEKGPDQSREASRSGSPPSRVDQQSAERKQQFLWRCIRRVQQSEENFVVVPPIGSAKTHILVESARGVLARNAAAKIIVALAEPFLAPRVASLFIAGFGATGWRVATFASSKQIALEKWKSKLADHSVLVMSAVLLFRLLSTKTCNIDSASGDVVPSLPFDDIDMLMLDDVHRAHGDKSPYGKVVNLYKRCTGHQQVKIPQVLGVTMFPHRMGDPTCAMRNWNQLVNKLGATVFCMDDQQAEIDLLNAPALREEALVVEHRDEDIRFGSEMGEFVAMALSMFEHIQGTRTDLAALGPIPRTFFLSKGRFDQGVARWLAQTIEAVQSNRGLGTKERSDLVTCLIVMAAVHDALGFSLEFGHEMALKGIWETVNGVLDSQTLASLRAESQVPFIAHLLECLCQAPSLHHRIPSDLNPSLVDCAWFPRFTALVSMLVGYASHYKFHGVILVRTPESALKLVAILRRIPQLAFLTLLSLIGQDKWAMMNKQQDSSSQCISDEEMSRTLEAFRQPGHHALVATILSKDFLQVVPCQLVIRYSGDIVHPFGCGCTDGHSGPRFLNIVYKGSSEAKSFMKAGNEEEQVMDFLMFSDRVERL